MGSETEFTDLSFINSSLGGIPVDSARGRVDWNRDGSLSGTAPPGGSTRCRTGERVRAVINWGYSGCDAHIQGGTVLSPQVSASGRPDGGDLIGAPAMTRVRVPGAETCGYFLSRPEQSSLASGVRRRSMVRRRGPRGG
jgi:hypothetical protein